MEFVVNDLFVMVMEAHQCLRARVEAKTTDEGVIFVIREPYQILRQAESKRSLRKTAKYRAARRIMQRELNPMRRLQEYFMDNERQFTEICEAMTRDRILQSQIWLGMRNVPGRYIRRVGKALNVNASHASRARLSGAVAIELFHKLRGRLATDYGINVDLAPIELATVVSLRDGLERTDSGQTLDRNKTWLMATRPTLSEVASLATLFFDERSDLLGRWIHAAICCDGVLEQLLDDRNFQRLVQSVLQSGLKWLTGDQEALFEMVTWLSSPSSEMATRLVDVWNRYQVPMIWARNEHVALVSSDNAMNFCVTNNDP